jgi:hypothetical protein
MGKLTTGLVAAVLSSMTVVGVAQALRRVPGFIGRSDYAPNIGCTNISGHFLRNECGTGIWIEVPLAFENSGTKNVTFTINSADTSSACALVAVDNTGFLTSPARNVTAVNTFQTLTTDSIAVASGQQMFADCFLSANARMTALSYGQ